MRILQILAAIGISLLLGFSTQAQTYDLALSQGVTHFSGDLGNFDGAIQWNGFRPGTAITYRNFLNNKKRYVTRAIDLEARLAWYRLGYDETQAIGDQQGNKLKNYGRGLSFRNDLFGASGHFVLNAYREPYTPLFQQKFFMFFYTGIGVYYGRPKADLFNGDIDINNRYHFWSDGTVRNISEDNEDGLQGQVIEKDGVYETDLYSWSTEGENGPAEGANTSVKNTPWHIGVPFGFGIRYMLTKQLKVGFEYSYISFFSDRLDDVSGRYVTDEELNQLFPNDPEKQELARYISDPTDRGTNGDIGVYTSRRGNPGLPDAFTYAAFDVTYTFKKRPARRSFVIK